MCVCERKKYFFFDWPQQFNNENENVLQRKETIPVELSEQLSIFYKKAFKIHPIQNIIFPQIWLANDELLLREWKTRLSKRMKIMFVSEIFVAFLLSE